MYGCPVLLDLGSLAHVPCQPRVNAHELMHSIVEGVATLDDNLVVCLFRLCN